MSKKLTDEKLAELLKKGWTQKQIAYRYGYGYPSSALSRRIKKIGLQKQNKLNFSQRGNAATLSIDGETIQEAAENTGKNIQPGKQPVYFTAEPVEEGILLKLDTKKWKEKE